MNHRERLWERVDEAWDERADPLQDELVQRLVEEDPTLLVELAETERALRGTQAWRTAIVRRRWSYAVAAAGLVVLAGWTAHRAARRGSPETVPPHADPTAPACAVLACRVTLEHADARGTEILRAEDGTHTRTFMARDGTRIESAVCTALARDPETRP